MKILVRIKDKIVNTWQRLPDWLRRLVHTAYQSFIGVFLLGITNVIADLLQSGNFSSAKAALVALVSSGVAVAISAVKALILSQIEGKD